MAYGNWGAFVWRNSERMPQWEDQTPYLEQDAQSGYIQAFARSMQVEGKQIHPHHAVLGQQRLRLCGHKNYPVLLVDGEEINEQEFLRRYAQWPLKIDEDDGYIWSETYGGQYNGEIDGYRFRVCQFNGNMIDLELVEPDGTIWQSRCGYTYGAGYMKDEDAPDPRYLDWRFDGVAAE